jgi:hypothetical protein
MYQTRDLRNHFGIFASFEPGIGSDKTTSQAAAARAAGPEYGLGQTEALIGFTLMLATSPITQMKP